MKWVGQHIYDLVSRFRQKVYIESGDIEVSKVSGQPVLELSAWSATATAAHAGVLKFQKSGTAAVDTFTAGDHTTSGEILGRIEAYGVDDADGSTLSSYIEFANDAVSDADSSPGKIIFATSDADDAGTPTVRLTIDDDGLSTFVGAVSIGGNLTFDSVGLTALQTSAESFVDNDTSIMTSAAIADKIEAYGYSTTAGDITGVVLTADDSNTVSSTEGSANFTIQGNNGISTGIDTHMTISGVNASTSAKGVVELATTAEVGTGTDTARAVTPDALADGYVGTANITTLGTISTGVWNGTAITKTYLNADQRNITQVGTLTSLTVDDIAIDTKTITITGDTDDTCTITTGAAGATTITTTDTAGAAGHFLR